MVKIIVVVGVSLIVGFLAGNGSVYGFNRLPDSWLGTAEPDRHWQRVKSTPWKLVLAAVFIACGMYTGLADAARAPGVFVAVFLLVWIAMASKLYGLAPRPLVWMLLICGVGMIPFEQSFKPNLIGAAVMLGCGGVICLIELLIKKNAGSEKGEAAMSEKPADQPFEQREARPAVSVDLWELMVVVGFLTGTVQSLVILQTSLIFWAIRSLIPAGERVPVSATAVKAYRSDGRELKTKNSALKVFDVKEPLSFFFAICAAFWLTVNTGHILI